MLGRRVVPEDDPRYQVEVLGQFPTRESVRLVSDEELGHVFAGGPPNP